MCNRRPDGRNEVQTNAGTMIAITTVMMLMMIIMFMLMMMMMMTIDRSIAFGDH